MQPLNDDMDNLFRQAAEQYPLSNHGASFDKVLQQLGENTPPAPPEKKRRRFLWLLLLLIPIPFVYEHHQSASKNGAAQHSANATKANAFTATNTQTNNASKTANSISDNSITGTEKTTSSTPTQQAISEQTNAIANKQNVSKTPVTTSKNAQQTNNKTAFIQQDYSSKKSISKNVEVTFYSSAIASRKANSKNKKYNTNTSIANSKEVNTSLAGNDDKNDLVNNQPDPNATTPVLADSTQLADSANNTIAKQTDSSKQVITQAKKATDSISSTAKKKDKRDAPAPKSFLYVGGVSGTDISTVKSFNTHGLGYNAGFIVGYRFRKHLGIETGLLWNYKKYYADGQYVSTDKLGLRLHTQVLNIDGSCGMIEIPLTFQYHFGKVGNSHWYAAAGVSSYLMKREEYYYLSKYYNMQYYGEKTYKNSIQNWFSVLQVSAGYQLQTGKKGALRFEPYIKLPLAKIGIAQMPLSSAGLNVGYILQLR